MEKKAFAHALAYYIYLHKEPVEVGVGDSIYEFDVEFSLKSSENPNLSFRKFVERPPQTDVFIPKLNISYEKSNVDFLADEIENLGRRKKQPITFEIITNYQFKLSPSFPNFIREVEKTINDELYVDNREILDLIKLFYRI